MTNKLQAAILALVIGMIVISFVPVKVRATPVLSDPLWEPKYPQLSDTVTLSVRVEDSSFPITIVQASYCSLPLAGGPGECRPVDLEDPDMDDVYSNTTIVFPDSVGADVVFTGVNSNGDWTETPKYYIQYALSINVTAVADKSQVYPGERFNLTVGATYYGNASAPTENSSVLVRRIGGTEQWTGETDENGNYTVGIDAPATIEIYTYNVTISNRSLSGWAEAEVKVQVEPLPDFVVEEQDIVLSKTLPEEGESVAANITVENNGDLNDTFRVVVTLHGAGTTTTLANVSLTIEPGEDEHISVSWNAMAGIQYLNVTVDPGNFVKEASEMNNHASISITGTPIIANDDGLPIALFAGVALIVIVVIALVAVLLRRRKA